MQQRKMLPKRRQRFGHQRKRRHIGIGQPNVALHVGVKPPGDALDALVILFHLLKQRQAGRPGRGQSHLMTIPLEQRDPQFALHLLNLLADGGLGNEQLFRRPRKAQLLRHAHKHLNGLYIHVSSPIVVHSTVHPCAQAKEGAPGFERVLRAIWIYFAVSC